jgi:signal transduction histidine kinase
MTPQDILLAAASTGFGLLAGWSANRLSTRGSREQATALGDGLDAARRQLALVESACGVFDSAVIMIDDGAPRLVAGAAGLAAVATAIGIESGEVSDVLRALADLDPDFQRRLEALMRRGEECAFQAAGPSGGVLVEGRSSGVWAWLRLGRVAGSQPGAPRADRLAALVDGQEDPAWITSADGEPEWVNRAWLEAVALPSLAEARGKGVVLDRTAAPLAKAASAGGAVERALSWVNSARGRRAYRLSAAPLQGGGAALWARDVTDLENAQEQLRRQSSASALVLDRIGDAAAVFDAGRRLVFQNPAFVSLWELEPAWLAERPTHAELLDRLRQRRKLPETTDYARFKSEELAGYQQVEDVSDTIWRLPSERTLRVVRLPQPDGGLALIFSDITPELRLKSQFNHLIQVQRATLDKLSDAVAVFGADGRLKLHNEAFEAFWGIAAGALQDAPFFDDVVELCIPRLHNRQFWRDLKGRITDPDPRARAPWEDELTTAERRVVAFQSRPLPDGATLIGFADITDTRRLEEALRDREAALAEAARLKRAFVGSVSYELRTPLTTIIGYAELLERDEDGLAEKERGYIGAVRAAASHLARSINDVLATAEIDAGETVLEIGDVDIGALLSAAAARSADEARSARVDVEISIDSDFGLMSGDSTRLGQVLDHLIENALRHTPAGGVISLSATRAPGEVRLSVADNGRGFPFDVQAHIFDRFSSHNRGGPGLGLALVRALVELHGGWVALESEPGTGATFTCHLPEVAQASEARPRLI